MSLIDLTVMYGHLEGAGRNFARDPTGYLSIEAGIFQKHGLNISWQHVQGTEERYRRLENGSAQVSLLVGRASLPHFLTAKSTRLLGAVMSSCPYYLIARSDIAGLADLKGKIVACREGPSRHTPIADTFLERARLRVGADLSLQLLNGDQEAFDALIGGKAQAALLPRPFGFLAEEKGFKRIKDWPEIVDDPLPITIETTLRVFRERENDLRTFLRAHSEGIRYFKSHRADALRILTKQFGHGQVLAEKIVDDYVTRMDETLKVDFEKFAKLMSQVSSGAALDARQVAAEWIAPGGLKG
jgi:ABC-type nitrate/sulfonate/bicarbonate transport system substrate-binding protein